MENIIVSIVIIFLLLFGAMTMSSAYISAEQTMMTAQQQRDTRVNDIARTAVSPVEMRILNSGSVIEVRLHNSGSLKLADFDHWDVFAEYYDDSAVPAYQSNKLPFDTTSTAINAWSIGGIYLDWKQNISEDFDPGILNPGEDIVLRLNISPSVGVGQSAQVTIVTENGVSQPIMGKRNAPPTITLNTGFKVALHGSQALTPSILLAQDADNDPDELTYAVTTAPTQGTLIPATQFTQQQINDGAVVYTHTGTDADSFAFTVSDGIDSIGPFNATIAINAAPVLATGNPELTLPAGTMATITNILLQTTDVDDPADKLIYTITQFPANGLLSLGSTFSQDDIDHNRLTYTHTGTDADMFKFVVSDGYDVIGTKTFIIALVG